MMSARHSDPELRAPGSFEPRCSPRRAGELQRVTEQRILNPEPTTG